MLSQETHNVTQRANSKDDDNSNESHHQGFTNVKNKAYKKTHFSPSDDQDANQSANGESEPSLISILNNKEFLNFYTKIVKEGFFFKLTHVKNSEVHANKNLKEALKNLRVIQNELLYVIGLSPRLTEKNILMKPEYFGQYGKILKLVVNKSKMYNPKGSVGPSYSAYITFSSAKEAAIAILAIDQIMIDDRMIRASFGTTKYCTFFLKNQNCLNKDCLYLHEFRLNVNAVSKDEVNNRELFSELQKAAFNLTGIENIPIEEYKNIMKKFRGKNPPVFPSPESVYTKSFTFMKGTLLSKQTLNKSDILTLQNKGGLNEKIILSKNSELKEETILDEKDKKNDSSSNEIQSVDMNNEIKIPINEIDKSMKKSRFKFAMRIDSKDSDILPLSGEIEKIINNINLSEEDQKISYNENALELIEDKQTLNDISQKSLNLVESKLPKTIQVKYYN